MHNFNDRGRYHFGTLWINHRLHKCDIINPNDIRRQAYDDIYDRLRDSIHSLLHSGRYNLNTLLKNQNRSGAKYEKNILKRS